MYLRRYEYLHEYVYVRFSACACVFVCIRVRAWVCMAPYKKQNPWDMKGLFLNLHDLALLYINCFCRWRPFATLIVQLTTAISETAECGMHLLVRLNWFPLSADTRFFK